MSTLYWSLREAIEKQQLCLNVNFVLVLKGSSQVAEKRVALARIGHSATTWCSFMSLQKRKQRKYQRIMGNSSQVTYVVLTWTWCITTWVRSAKCVGFCQRLCLVVRVDLMFITAGNKTKRAHKIWRERLLAWNIFPQAVLEFNRWNKRIWNHGCQICVSR